MTPVRLILALHDHQPVGNFDGVFEAAYRESYRPFLDVLEGYPDLKFVLHISGPLLEWLADREPGYIERVRGLVVEGRVEILGGPRFEPILSMIPARDRVGQIRQYSAILRDLFGVEPRGAWLPERVWEQHIASDLAEAGVEYTILDDFHFARAGLSPQELHGYYLTEDEGRLLKLFPNSEPMRYLVPWEEPHASYEYLRDLASRHPGALVVCGDDGEKFGAWPKTHEHVFDRGWLRHFCDMLRDNRDWLQTATLAEAADSTLPVGKIYVPDCSYREMTEWALPTHRSLAHQEAARRLEAHPEAEHLRPYVRGGAGGYWRNFKAKYPESDEMYARMLGLSRRLDDLKDDPEADPDLLEAAREELYRGQCNCPYWHGAFGGLYLPHLRNAIYRHLIAADNLLDEAEGKPSPRIEVEDGDFNLDGRREVRLANEHLVALLRPATGGHLYELDVRHALTNVLATLDRRPEPYHATVRAAARGEAVDDGRPAVTDEIVLKQEHLDERLVYDRQPRKALVDHFLAPETTLDDLAACRDVERGDFALGTYLARVRREPGRAVVVMERPGRADGHAVRVRKTIALEAGAPILEVRYELVDLPAEARLIFAVEINTAAMAGSADDRYYRTPEGDRLGQLSGRLDLPSATGLALVDEWLDLGSEFEWSRPAGLWSFPIETVSQSEGGFEGVYQGSAIVARWEVAPDADGRWSVELRWTLGRANTAEVGSIEPDRVAEAGSILPGLVP